jgi:uncharacterized protein YdbL (DUF1318 family)
MKITALFRLCALVLVLLTGAIAAPAQDLAGVKARMAQRLNTVNALKDRGIAGENNQGFLEVRGTATAPEQKTIAEENADRRAAYAALAAQTGVTPEAVGRQRAQQLANLARRGVWIQDSSGSWRQKG